MAELKPFLDDMLSMATGPDGRTLHIHFSRPVTKDDRQAFADAHNAIVRGQLGDPPREPQMQDGELASLTAERNLFKGKYRSMASLMEKARSQIRQISDHTEDEGDRAYFGSSNHADWLQDLAERMELWVIDFELPKGDINKMERDPYAEIRNQRARAETAVAALKLAIGHMEHMAAFIAAQNAGYSFESLGEDMPGIKAALEVKS